jgi:HEAT repeat protein
MTRARLALLVLASSLTLGACASSGAMRAASRGDFASLKTDVAAREHAGSLGNHEAAQLARAVAEWEIANAPSDEQVARMKDLRSCARDVSSALDHRAGTHDAAGAEAALALVEAGEWSAGSARDYATDKDDVWRAVGARGLVRAEDDAAARARAFVDPAPAVRRSAMHAAVVAKDPRDVDALAEAARVDPEPIVRTDATRALGSIGGPPAFAKLRDLWTGADDAQREDLASAYADPATFAAGGRDELRVVLAADHGPAAIEAAGAVLRSPTRDPELDASATALLARTIAKSSRRDRLHAIAVAPFSPIGAVTDALRAAATDSDLTIRIAVLARLAAHSVDHDASVTALEALAAPGSNSNAVLASRARLALAAAGDLRIQAWLEADLASGESTVRLSAATALSTLGRVGRAAPLLADADPSVRTRAACTILLGAR